MGRDHRAWGVNTRRRGSLGPTRMVATQGRLLKNCGAWGGLGAGLAPGPDAFAAGAEQKGPHAPSRSPGPGPGGGKQLTPPRAAREPLFGSGWRKRQGVRAVRLLRARLALPRKLSAWGLSCHFPGR